MENGSWYKCHETTMLTVTSSYKSHFFTGVKV